MKLEYTLMLLFCGIVQESRLLNTDPPVTIAVAVTRYQLEFETAHNVTTLENVQDERKLG